MLNKNDIIATDSDSNGGVSQILFHCIFNGTHSVNHFMHSNDDFQLPNDLSNHYSALINMDKNGKRETKAAIVIKTTYHHSDGDDFLNSIMLAMSSVEDLASLIDYDVTLSPRHFRAPQSGPPISENEFLSLVVQHFVDKGGVAGSA